MKLCRVRHKRKTFGSVLAQNGVSTAVIQRLMEHSSSALNNKVYTNVDPAFRSDVNLILALDGLWYRLSKFKFVFA